MKWSNYAKIRIVLVGFVAAVLLSGGVSAQPGEESLESMWERMGSTWTLKTDMPTARFIAGSAVVDGKIYVVGGALVGGSGSVSNIVEEYDPEADTWTRCANMPTSRQGVRAAAVDGIVYAIGGFGGGVTVEAYNPTTDTWTRKTSMPTERTIMAVVTVDGKIYVIGGEGGGILRTVEVYDPATDTWTRKADMPTERWALAADVVDGKIYVFGGARLWEDVPPLNVTPIVEVYNPATDTWTRASDMPRARFCHSASAVNGKIYIIGGAHDTMQAPTEGFLIVDVYDPATDTWTTATDLPAGAHGAQQHAASVVDGKIYTIGGWMGPGTRTFPTVQEFTPAPKAKNLMAFSGEILMSKSADLTQADIPVDFYNRVKELNAAEPDFIELWAGQGANNVAGEFTSEIQVLGYLVFPPGVPSVQIGAETWELETMTMADGDQLFIENAVTVDQTIADAVSVRSVIKTITGGTGKYASALGFADGMGTEDESGASLTFEGLISTNFVVLNVPDESTGPPSYADLGRDFIPADGTQVAIVFGRDPACVRPEFNLLDTMDIPAAFECPFLLGGQDWWHEPFVDFPFKSVYILDNGGAVPIYFVDLAELNSEIADDQLTLGELETFSSLKVGQATYVRNDILNSNAPDSDGKGHGTMTAIGTLDESGEFFYVHWSEEFRPEIGKNVFLDTVIRFFPPTN